SEEAARCHHGAGYAEDRGEGGPAAGDGDHPAQARRLIHGAPGDPGASCIRFPRLRASARRLDLPATVPVPELRLWEREEVVGELDQASLLPPHPLPERHASHSL